MSEEDNQLKYVRVPANGQISIGKAWSGRQIKIEQISPSELLISSGVFVADSLKAFYTDAAMERLKEFDDWTETHPPKKTDLKTLKQRFVRKNR